MSPLLLYTSLPRTAAGLYLRTFQELEENDS